MARKLKKFWELFDREEKFVTQCCEKCGHDEEGHTKKYGCVRLDEFPNGNPCGCKGFIFHSTKDDITKALDKYENALDKISIKDVEKLSSFCSAHKYGEDKNCKLCYPPKDVELERVLEEFDKLFVTTDCWVSAFPGDIKFFILQVYTQAYEKGWDDNLQDQLIEMDRTAKGIEKQISQAKEEERKRVKEIIMETHREAKGSSKELKVGYIGGYADAKIDILTSIGENKGEV